MDRSQEKVRDWSCGALLWVYRNNQKDYQLHEQQLLKEAKFNTIEDALEYEKQKKLKTVS